VKPIPIRVAATPAAARSDDAEGARVMRICNACRYCEGFCAVFPAMTRRLEFGTADLHYLANLCHNCGACLHACQYAPPHEFQLNVPRAMARLRGETYQRFAWPRPFGALYRRNGVAVALALAIALAVALLALLVALGGVRHPPRGGDFYSVMPHAAMVWSFGPVFAFALVALAVGVGRFWHEVDPGPGSAEAAMEAGRHALTLRYLDGGHGDGCNEEDDRYTLARRWFHHATFYGFLLCFAATCVATVYHYALAWPAPYPLISAPVILGSLGGLGLLVGPAGLLWLNVKRHPLHGDPTQRPMDRAFIVLLLLVSATGFALLLARDTGAMGLWLAVHLATVMALFVTLPYGKFAHAVYRGAALLKWSIERRQPNRIRLTDD
jgi:citrate/tricarballylate utilization protein